MNVAVLYTLFALSIGSPGMSEPDRKAEAARLLNEGNHAFASGKLEYALSRYEKAYAMFESPKLYYSLARALDQLGRHEDAARFYERFLVESGVEHRSPLYERA